LDAGWSHLIGAASNALKLPVPLSTELLVTDTLNAVQIVLGCALAWFLWGFPAVRRLDDRVLGERGVATVASVVTLLLVAGTGASLVQQVWAVAAVYALMSCWVGYWACRRVDHLRRARRG
jgi:hypothetical protein